MYQIRYKKKVYKILSNKGGIILDYRIITVIIVVTVILTTAIMKLWPYIKDFKITPEEKKKVEAIILETVKEILNVATADKTKEQLVFISTGIVVGILEKENITSFKESEIELMISRIIDKLEEECPRLHSE